MSINPLQAVVKVFKKSSIGCSISAPAPCPPGYRYLAAVSVEAQIFYREYQSYEFDLQQTQNIYGAEKVSDASRINQKPWNTIGTEEQRKLMSQVLWRMFWEVTFAELPHVADYLGYMAVCEEGHIAVQESALQLIPPVYPPNHYGLGFFKTLKSILAFERCVFDGSGHKGSKMSGPVVGKVTSEKTRQLVMFSRQLEGKVKRDFSEVSEWEIDRHFADRPHMEYVRYARLMYQVSQQVKLLQSLVQFGIAEEAINFSIADSILKQGEMGLILLHIDDNWNLVAIPV